MSSNTANDAALGDAVRHHHVLLDLLTRDVSAKVQENFKVDTTNPHIPYENDLVEYSVAREAELDEIALNNMARFTELESKIAQKYGMKPLGKDAVNEILELRSQIQADSDNVKEEVLNRYKELEMRGLDENKFEEYVAEVQDAYYSTIATPESNKVQIGIGQDLFRVVSGAERYREGGLIDGHIYPSAMRQSWLENGFTAQTSRRAPLAQTLTSTNIFGPKIAGELESLQRRGAEFRKNLIENKIGSKLLFGIYGGMLLWVMWFKWILINERESNRQRIKFSYRILDEDARLTRKQLSLMKMHTERTKKYYDEDDDDDDDDY